MPAMPDEDDFPDLFTDGAGKSADEMLAISRLQVGLVVGAGVLVIIITTLVVVLMGRNGQSIADGPNRPVGITSPLPAPAPVVASAEPSESPLPTRSVTATPTLTKKPTTSPPTTSPPTIATLTSLSCTSPVTGGQDATCSVSLSGPAHAALNVAISSSKPSLVSVPASASIPLGQSAGSFTAGTAELSQSGDSATVTATLDGVERTFIVNVTP